MPRRRPNIPPLPTLGVVMLRLTEIGLFLLPFAVFGLCWWFGSLSPSPAMLAFAVVCLAAFAGYLLWYGSERSLPPGAVYVPAQLVNGTIIPGHAAPP